MQAPAGAIYSPQQWAQRPQHQMQFMQAFPAHMNGAAAPTMMHAQRVGGEASACSQAPAHVHPRMHGAQQQQQQAAGHRQASQPSQQGSQKHPLPISHAEMGKLFQAYLKSKKITREQFSKEHRDAFKQMVLQMSAQRLKQAQEGAGDQQQQQHAQQQQQQQQQYLHQGHPHQQHLQHQVPQQHLQYAVVMNHQNALARGAQMHLQQCHAQGSMHPSSVEQSPTHSLHALNAGHVPRCGALDTAMLSQGAMHGANGMHANGALGALPSGRAHGVSSMNAAIGSPHGQHLDAPHAVHAGGHMHLQGPAMYPMGMQGHVLGHGAEAMNHMGGLAVQSHHPNARCEERSKM